MRILVYSLNFSPELTGTGKYTGEMAYWLASKGHSVRVVTTPPYYPKWSIFPGFRNFWSVSVDSGIKIYRCPVYVPSSDSGLRRIIHLISFSIFSFPVMLWQLTWKPDVIWGLEPTLASAPSTWITARLSRAKCWLHVQDFEVDMAYEMNLLRWGWLQRLAFGLERFLMYRFDRVSTISSAMRTKLLQKGVRMNSLCNFPNWADVAGIYPLSRPSAFRKSLSITEGNLVALYSGNMGHKQGLELLVETARLIENSIPSVRFILCGEGSAKDDLIRSASRLSNIIWLSLQPIEQLNELLNLADFHILPQRADAADLVMPSKLTNMLASGRPVIATAHKDTELFNVVKGCGLVIPPENCDALILAIQQLVEDDKLRARLGHAARRYAENNLAKITILNQFESDLEGLCQ